MHRKLLPGLVLIALLANVVMITAASFDTSNGIKVIGCSVKDHRAINGTTVISFLLQSEVAISSVFVSYVDQQERWANATMSLVEGNANYGWWEATINPKVWEEKVDGETRCNIHTPKLYVFLPHAVIELAIPQSFLPLCSIREEKVTFHLSEKIMTFLALGGISVIGVTIALKRYRCKEVTTK